MRLLAFRKRLYLFNEYEKENLEILSDLDTY